MKKNLKKYITPERMQEIDRLAQSRYGIPSIVLMENAGRAVAEEALEVLKNLKNKSVVCVCGKGNNGGDGFVSARHLINYGFDVKVFLAARPCELQGDARVNYEILSKMGHRVYLLASDRSMNFFKKILKKSVLILDAVFGIGFKGDVRAPFEAIFEAMNRSLKPILSIDVPSGLDALTGQAGKSCIKAFLTITFARPKTGFAQNDGPRFCGRVLVKDISIPLALMK